MTQEKKKFDAEVGKVLHLMINSLYANKEIFLRELISNSSDACDKLRYLSQINHQLIQDETDLKINISINKDTKTITVRDNGIGLNRQDLQENLGTIAKSGTEGFFEQLSSNSKKHSQLIGQFGVGFYSCFMVADKVTVTSRKAGEEQINVWESDGQGEYTISSSHRDFTRGTEIILHIRESEQAYIDHFKVKNVIKNYSDHISIPIIINDEDNKQIQINSSSALWTKSKDDITDKQYKEFYQNVGYATDDPWYTLHNKNEGLIEFTNLLFIPSTKTFDLFHPDRKCRVKLYIKRVFIADDNVEIIPQYLRFLRGVVDAEDLPLNISRETLQNNSVLDKIKKSITKRVISELAKVQDNDRAKYLIFWNNFGGVVKEGLCEVQGDHNALLKVCLFRSTIHDKMISLDEYIQNAKEDIKTIYYLSGNDPKKLRDHPQIEGFISQGIDVLLFTDTVDDFWVNINGRYKDLELKSVTRSNIDLSKNLNSQDEMSSTEKDNSNNASIVSYFKEILGSLVKDVQISKKLTTSPVCLAVNANEMDIRMERYLIEQKQLTSASAKILEINPQHKIIIKIGQDIKTKNNQNTNSALVHLLYDQACIIDGEPVSDVGAFAKRLNKILENTVTS
jgi:molecular chaperone HtpG